MKSDDLREAFTKFFTERGHVAVPSASLIPHDPSILFTVAGMVPFKPYFLGEEVPPYKRATSVQKCMRAGGKHNDLDQIGRTARHLTFFEMLGNFSFGDYFKEEAIPMAWQLVTEVLGFDPERIWITVHLEDDESEQIWRDAVGFDPSRIQRLDEDNWWQMGEVGPCGPCSEIYLDKGEEFGAGGGPAHGSDERFLEIWNLVFMQFNRQPDQSLEPLPKPSIDTGAGLERILEVLQGKSSIFDTDVIRPILDVACDVTKTHYGRDEGSDVALRIMADHARSMSFLVADGVYPSNEGRGYVLRRIIRRAALRSFSLGVDRSVTPQLVESVVSVMGSAYPELVTNKDFIVSVISREEERFRNTLKAGSMLLDQELALGDAVSGEAAFRLHDTYGFPIELTEEIAADRGFTVDRQGFDSQMKVQRDRARAAGKEGGVDLELQERYREIAEQFGVTQFTGYEVLSDTGRLVGMVERPAGGEVELFFDRTPFYAESGGQVGDTGTVVTESARVQVVDTSYALPGLIRHRAKVVSGELTLGQMAQLDVDAERRTAIRRNHTATHLLHSALREVLGDHVKQQGSLVAPDRLRFDFSHWAPLSWEERARVMRLVNMQILSAQPVEVRETSKSEALEQGAMAFFGDKYGERVRMVRAGEGSLELCGGTHVDNLAEIGPIVIVSESSIGANTRRIEALTGMNAIEHYMEIESVLHRAAAALRTNSEELVTKLESIRERESELVNQLKVMQARELKAFAKELAMHSRDGRVLARQDNLEPELMRELALLVRAEPGVSAVVLIGTPDTEKASLVAAVTRESGLIASDLLRDAAEILGGGTGKQAEFAQAGGKNVAKLGEAFSIIESLLFKGE
ncbi:MAG: alanine--tRNA ligase [Actinomycetota bacterium]|jgi:alanyl-tRNA synthetase|nr:alanine--tRNA ligase [Actinomycetota bacterium]